MVLTEYAAASNKHKLMVVKESMIDSTQKDELKENYNLVIRKKLAKKISYEILS